MDNICDKYICYLDQKLKEALYMVRTPTQFHTVPQSFCCSLGYRLTESAGSEATPLQPPTE